nr:uncharacterized protein LOC109184816 [Ipomoea batatas]
MTTFSDMDSDEWGIMTLREKVVELSFNKDANLSSDGSDWEEGESANELEEFEGSEYENDKVEYGGVQVPTNVEVEKHVGPQAADAVNLSYDGPEFQTTTRPIPQLPSPLWLGWTFSKKVEFKYAIKVYAIQYGKELKFMKNDKREAVTEEIPVNTQSFKKITDDELFRLFDCPFLGIPNIGYHSVRVDPLLNVGDNIIGNSLTNVQNMPVDNSQMEITPSSQLLEEMDNTSQQQQEQK